MGISWATVARALRARLMLLALVLVVALALFGSAADAEQLQTCATLKGRHLASGTRAVVVTQLINKEKTEGLLERVAYVCASPRGHARRVGSVTSTAGEHPGIKVVAGAGEWVALRYESVIGEGFSESESAANATTGRHFQYWRAGGGMGTYFGNLLEAVKLDAQGQLALITGVEGKPKNEGEQAPAVLRKVIGVESNGKRKVLDSAPTADIATSSLRITSDTIYWTDRGTERNAQL